MKKPLMKTLYSLLWFFIFPIVLLRLWVKGRKQPAYRKRIKERLSIWPNVPQGCLWIHAVSVGETIAAKVMVERWLHEHPEIPVLVTTMTPTGSETVLSLFGNRVHHAYLPWDLMTFQKKLIKNIKPRMLIIMETELWPNLISACKAADVPVLVANARLSEKSKLGYQRFESITAPMLENITGIAAQHTPDADRFIELGVSDKKLQVTGSIKFDIKVDSETVSKTQFLRMQIGKRPIWIAASTHEGEEELLVKAHSKLMSKVPNALLILVPRHPERADRIAGLLYKQHFSFVRRTEDKIPGDDHSIFLIDTLGELMIFFGLADAAFIGNTINNGGGHNPIEPASLAKPVILGPSYTNFKTIVDAMRSDQAVIIVEDIEELTNRLIGLLQSKDLRDTYGQRAYLFFQQQQGALDRLLSWIEKIINVQKKPLSIQHLKSNQSIIENNDSD